MAFRLLAVLLALAVLGGPLALHLGQRAHDRLPFDVATRFPDDQPIVGGEVFATTVIEIVQHELQGGTGWRPNDFFLWGPGVLADNNANRQRGIILAVRESVRVLKDHLTKVSSDDYDAHLLAAHTAFQNDAERFWFPSAESKLADGVQSLREYVAGLAATPIRSKRITGRNVELIRLFQAWGDMLGDAHAALFRSPEPILQTDDDFYRAQGMTHVVGHLTKAVAREYKIDFASRPTLVTLLDEVGAALLHAARLKPLVVLDGTPDGLFANHRRNLDTFVTEARQKMYSIREELEK